MKVPIVCVFIDRLASEMSTKISADESSVENVSIKNRPMNISTEYELFCSDQWLNAKNALDQYYPQTSEQHKLLFLSNILQVQMTFHYSYIQYLSQFFLFNSLNIQNLIN